RQSDAFDDAVRRVEESIAGTIGPFIEADIDEAHRELLGYAIVGLAEVTSRQWIQRRVDGPEDPEAVLAEADVLAQRLADLVWAGLRALPGAPGRERRE
ncbi:MAG TPA: hypothetical protein VKV25_00050, partial [Acidimicrobiales bacterium]|nr:hypothetical protein [Acidimicrobiales bacterium]